jgi:TonB family protein
MSYTCPEKWENMRIGLTSRHCDNCQKNVQDFTGMTREQILLYLIQNRNSSVCGRIYRSQIDFSRQEILFTVEHFLQRDRKSNTAFFLLAFGTLTLMSCEAASDRENSICAADSVISGTFLSDESHNLFGDSVSCLKNPSNTLIEQENDLPEIPHLIGLIDIEPEPGPDAIWRFAEVMPEFPGGVDSLFAFLKSNTRYPEWEWKNKIAGTVYVSFVIDIKGNVVNPKIVRSVKEAKNFDAEVLRVLSLMPTWQPAQENGVKVNLEYVIPFRFKLSDSDNTTGR